MGGGIRQIAPVRRFAFRIFLAALVGSLHFTRAADWPQWRYNSGHGAVTPHALPKQLHLQWSRQLKEAWPAWPATQSKLGFDLAPEPVVADGRLFVPNSTTASVSAYDTATGKELWRFYAEGAVRFAPVASKDKIWFVSDDGHLYCLNAADGKLRWKFNGGPAERWVIGNDRLVSTWPARGGPVYREGKIWFTASIWPFMGIFVHCLDAETGRVIWTNSGDGMNYTVQPHGAPSFATVAPQGHLVLAGNRLVVPGGRSTPAVFDAKTGKLSHFKFNKRRGHHRVYGSGDYYFVDGGRFQSSNGDELSAAKPQLVGEDYVIGQNGENITAHKLKGHIETKTKTDRKGKKTKESKFVVDSLWSAKVSSDFGRIFLQAGNQLYMGGKNKVSMFDIARLRAGQSKPAWTVALKEEPWTMLAADDRLFVVTLDGRLHCFGGNPAEPVHHLIKEKAGASAGQQAKNMVASWVRTPKAAVGYGLLLGAPAPEIISELLRQTKLQLTVVDADSGKVARLREYFTATAQYGTRVTVHHHKAPLAFAAPVYFANLVVINTSALKAVKASDCSRVFRAVRPYGGVLCVEQPPGQLNKTQFPEGTIQREDGRLYATRVGALPGAADWTHQYADAGQSVVSKDERVKAPLGLLWFGGPSNDKILPRHGHGPSPQVAGGRLFIEGPDILRAVDVYTGRLLWERELEGLGEYYNITGHFPGAGEIGSNYVSFPDAVYVVYGTTILELDAATGQTVKEFKTPKESNFGWLSVRDNYLVTTTAPIAVKLPDNRKKQKAFDAAAKIAKDAEANAKKIAADKNKKQKEKDAVAKTAAAKRKLADAAKKALAQAQAEVVDSRFASGSRQLAVFNRHTAKLLWTRDAKFNFRHNNIALGAGSIYVIDSLTEARLKALNRRGMKPKGNPSLSALDLKTGRVLWQSEEDIFGTFLNYSSEHDLLLQAGSAYRDRAKDDIGKGMIAYQGRSGKIMWANRDLSYSGPCLLLKDRIITNGNGGFALDIKTGKPTGWKYTRNYGCNTAIGSEHLLTFRSGAAGFYDLTNDGGTGNWGGFRSSCTANLIPANGILNAPDYTRTCSCAYQMQTSLGLIHMPELEYWTFGAQVPDEDLAINFGAPGDRRGPGGKLWLDFPEAGSPSVKVDVKIEPKSTEVFRHHSSRIKSGKLKWVGASGLEGVEQVVIKLKSNGQYRVKMHFIEPEHVQSAQRIFDVSLQDKTVLSKLDIAQVAGRKHQVIAREFKVAVLGQTLKIHLKAYDGTKPVLCGVQWVKIP